MVKHHGLKERVGEEGVRKVRAKRGADGGGTRNGKWTAEMAGSTAKRIVAWVHFS